MAATHVGTRQRLNRVLRRLPPPRDDAAIRVARALRDLVMGTEAVESRPQRRPRPRPRRAVAKQPAPPVQPLPASPPVENPEAADVVATEPPTHYTLRVPYRTPPGSPPEKYGPAAEVSLFAWPGDFGSPVVDPRTVRGRGSDDPELVDLPGIELSVADHEAVWDEWAPHVQRWEDAAAPHRRYHTGPENSMFGNASGRWLAGALGAIRPRRYVEIGSGFSSAIVLDINDEQRPEDPIACTFIDPKPDRLMSLLRPSDIDNCDFLDCVVQDVDLEVFDRLGPGDVLFIDSSHVAKSESDVVLELFTILPRLADGVYVHVHDIPYPFDYPRRWLVEQNRSWNEAYFLRAFLMYNSAFSVHFWTDFFALFCGADRDRAGLETLMAQRASSIWLRKGPAS